VEPFSGAVRRGFTEKRCIALLPFSTLRRRPDKNFENTSFDVALSATHDRDHGLGGTRRSAPFGLKAPEFYALNKKQRSPDPVIL